jgi:hypothetical protein
MERNRRLRTLICSFKSLPMLLAAGIGSASGANWMDEAAIRRELVGFTIVGYYRTGERFIDAYAADGGIVYSDDHATWSGEWSFHGDVFCTFYMGRQHGGCFLLSRVGDNCYEYFAVAEDWRGPGAPEGFSDPWVARGWRRGARSSCEEPPTV